MAASFFLVCAVLLSTIFSASSSSSGLTPYLPVTKDTATNLFLTVINQRTPLVPVNLTLDLGGRFLWLACDARYNSSTYLPAHCGSSLCSFAKSKHCSSCTSTPPRLTCNRNTCTLLPDNPIARTTSPGEVAADVLSLSTATGPLASAPRFLFSCAPPSLLAGLPAGSAGMAGLGRTSISFPSQLASAVGLARKFSLCLPTGSAVGSVQFGAELYLPTIGPLPFVYTPLLTDPVGKPSAEYFVGLESIKVSDKAVVLNRSLLATEISTVTPYMTLETTIYKAVTAAFAASAGHGRRVAAVRAFEYCYNVTSAGLASRMPVVDLGMKGGAVWRMYWRNSMVEVRKGVMCLAIVDGGVRPRTPVVIGGRQLEDNLLVFDLLRSRLGFTGTLLNSSTSCSGF